MTLRPRGRSAAAHPWPGRADRIPGLGEARAAHRAAPLLGTQRHRVPGSLCMSGPVPLGSHSGAGHGGGVLGAACWAVGRTRSPRPPPSAPPPPGRTAASGLSAFVSCSERPPRLQHFSASSSGLSTLRGSWGAESPAAGRAGGPGPSPSRHRPGRSLAGPGRRAEGSREAGGRKPLGSPPGQKLSRPNPAPPSGIGKQPPAARSGRGPPAGRPGRFLHSARPHPGPDHGSRATEGALVCPTLWPPCLLARAPHVRAVGGAGRDSPVWLRRGWAGKGRGRG